MKKHIVYLDLLRLFGIVAVVMVHVAVQNIGNSSISETDFLGLRFWEAINRFAVPLFVMISGALFLNPTKTITIKRLFGHNILRLLVFFFAWGAVYAISDLIFGKGAGFSLADFLFGHYHMWFIVMIIGLYMLTPIIRKITADESVLRYFLVLSIVVVFLLNWLIPEASKWLADATGISEMGRLAETYADLHLEISGYVVYYVLGYYLHSREIRRKSLLYTLGIAAAVAQIILVVKTGARSDMLPTVLIMCVAIFTLGKQLGSRIDEKSKFALVLAKLASYVLSVYLIHILILAILNRLGMSSVMFTPWLAVPVEAAAVLVGSFLIIHLMALLKIPVK